MAEAASLRLEEEAWSRGLSRVAGLDEAGRGPLAGPVVAAAVVLPRGRRIDGAADSKALPTEVREELFEQICARAAGWGLGAASVPEVERLNPLRASSLAMRRALAALGEPPDHLLVDGPEMDGLPEHRPVVGGDARCHSIACASILAKVIRDRLMRRLHPRYPDYGWRTNVGYGTREHLDALDRLGPTPHHRRTFGPVAQASLELRG